MDDDAGGRRACTICSRDRMTYDVLNPNSIFSPQRSITVTNKISKFKLVRSAAEEWFVVRLSSDCRQIVVKLSSNCRDFVSNHK